MSQNSYYSEWFAQAYRAGVQSPQPSRIRQNVLSKPPHTVILDPSGLQAHHIPVAWQDVRLGRVGALVEQLMALNENPAACDAMQGRMVIVQTRRSASDIGFTSEQLHKFVRHVHALWPYWLHFMRPDPVNMRFLAPLLEHDFNMEISGTAEELSSFIPTVAHMRGAGNILHRQLDISSQLSAAIHAKALYALHQAITS